VEALAFMPKTDFYLIIKNIGNKSSSAEPTGIIKQTDKIGLPNNNQKDQHNEQHDSASIYIMYDTNLLYMYNRGICI
jgi:hypothetical protein